MPGAAGITATNWAYSVAPKDGTVILATYNALLAEPLYGNPAARYDVLKFGDRRQHRQAAERLRHLAHEPDQDHRAGQGRAR